MWDGPWEQAFCVRMPFAVASKSNFRRHRAGSSGSGGWARQRSFEAALNALLRCACPSGWELGPATPAAVATRPVVVALIAAETLLDAANLPKSVTDAAEGVLYHNDASVRAVVPVVLARRAGDVAFVAFARLAPGAQVREIVDAAGALLERWVSTFVPAA